MGSSTFSGPLRVGTVREGSGKNVGAVPIMQQAVIPASALLTAPAPVVIARVPNGAKILNFIIEETVALATATNVGLTIGKTGGATNFFLTTFNTGAVVARVPDATVIPLMNVVNCNNVAGDTEITATPTAAGGNATAGELTINTVYVEPIR